MEGIVNVTRSIEQLPIEKIFSSPHQMRRSFDQATLRDLAKSMKQEGLIQPITVRKVGNAFELVVGERRLKAAQMLGWTSIDACVIDISDEDAAIKGLIENLQRADLTPIEEAKGYKQLVEQPYNMTQEAIAQRVGKSQTSIARSLALLELPEEVQELMPRGIITESHTRSLRKIADHARQVQLAKEADKSGWTVKEMERQVNAVLRGSAARSGASPVSPRPPEPDPMASAWESMIQAASGAGVRLSSVKYDGSGGWTMKFNADGAPNPHEALALFFGQLAEALNKAVSKDLEPVP